MKKPNFDFSKEGLKRFFLHHAEKVILVVAVVLTGMFFWLGFKSEAYKAIAPKGLSQKADEAHTYIVKNASWDTLKDFRQADDTVHVRIKNSDELVNLSQLLPLYKDGLITGIPERTLAKRSDPGIVLPTELVARTFNGSMLLRTSTNQDYALDRLAISGAVTEVGDGSESRGGNNAKEEAAIGVTVPEYQKIEKNGVRPTKVNANFAIARYVNVVTGVIDMDAQWKEYEALQNSMGYYPPRDKPNFRYLQVERMDSETNKWVDITSRIGKYNSIFAGGFPHFDPDGTVLANSAAPELIAPEHFDAALSRPIPSFTQFDYTEFVNHPGPTPLSLRKPPKLVSAAEADDAKSNSGTVDLFGSDTPKDPPANDGAAGVPGRGGQGVPGRGGTAPKGDDKAGPQLQRKGSDSIAEYTRIIKSAKKQSSHKLVRFFDILDEDVKAGTTYKYRIKVWLDDPNNAADKATVAKRKDGRDRDNLTFGGGGGAGSGMEGPDEGGSNRGSTGGSQATEETYTFVNADEPMMLDSVRERIMKSRERTFPEELNFLANARTAIDENGDEIWTESNSVTVGDDARNAYVYAGNISAPRKYKIDGKLIDAGERTVDLAVKTWQAEFDGKPAKNLGVPVPAARTEARVSDVLDFVADTNIMHPLDWTVRSAKNTTIKSSSMIVDVMGGDDVKAISSRTSSSALHSMKYQLPGEVLVMDVSKMNFQVQNDLNDREEYFHATFKNDEASAFGGRRNPKKADDKKDDSSGDESPFD